MILGEDGAGNAQYISTDSAGRINVNIGGGLYNTVSNGTANLVKDTPTSVYSEAGGYVLRKIYVAGSGLMKIDVKYGTTGAEVSKIVKFNSTANPNIEVEFPDGLSVIGSETIKVVCTNLENAASPASDFTGYASFIKENTA